MVSKHLSVMKRMLLLATAVAPVHPAVSQSVPPAATPPTNYQVLTAWTPGEIRCGGTVVTPRTLQRPWSALRWSTQRSPVETPHYRFRIDASGRAMSIQREGQGFVWGSEDIAPSLAVSRFPVGAPRSNCTIRYTPQETPLGDAPVGDLISYSLTPLSGKLPPEGWARIQPPDTSCLVEPRPQPLVQAFPNFNKLPGTPGVKHWSMLGYDLDGQGRPKNVRIVNGTRDAALDRVSVQAMRSSRFTGGPRTGCLYPFWRNPTTLVAPEAPAEDALRPVGSTCPSDDNWATPPRLSYAAPYQRRSIEGWAVVAYDVAPWGELGNLRVLASEPTADFGDQALRVLRAARKAPSPTGRTGCVDRVMFKIGYRGLSPEQDPA